MAAIFADVDLSDRPDAETIERRLRASFQAHGEQVPRGVTGMSRAIAAAGTRQPAIRSARFLGLGARALAGGVRWAWQPGADVDAKDRRALRGLSVAYGAFLGVAVLLTTGAVRASGWRRLPWAVAALLMWLFTTRNIAIGAVVTTVVASEKAKQTEREKGHGASADGT